MSEYKQKQGLNVDAARGPGGGDTKPAGEKSVFGKLDAVVDTADRKPKEKPAGSGNETAGKSAGDVDVFARLDKKTKIPGKCKT